MELIKPGTKINFIGIRRIGFVLSGLAIGASLMSIILHGGLNYGIDFAGGTLVQVKFSKPTQVKTIKGNLASIGLDRSVVQRFGEKKDNEYLIRVERSASDLETLSLQIEGTLQEAYGKGGVEIRRTEMVGPKVGKDLKRKGILAIIYALIGILIYITWRFEFIFALGAIIALVHDVAITVGAFSIANKEFSLPIVAAILTIIGYSLNDTIVVYDRIRENRRKMRREDLARVMNSSINETMSRTLLTSLTTLIVVVILFIFGGGVIHNFAFALIVGVLVGTYSSVFVASPIILTWQERK
ncbi:MAG: protein translocase subunit SecF [Thermodesulfobacteriota bacterium]